MHGSSVARSSAAPRPLTLRRGTDTVAVSVTRSERHTCETLSVAGAIDARFRSTGPGNAESGGIKTLALRVVSLLPTTLDGYFLLAPGQPGRAFARFRSAAAVAPAPPGVQSFSRYTWQLSGGPRRENGGSP